MAGTWTASIEDLKSLTSFLEGITEVSRRTGVAACVYGGVEVEIPCRTILRISSARSENGELSYHVDEHGD